MAKKVEVQSERLYLEPLSIVAHLDDFHELWATEEAVKWSSGPRKESVEESRPWLESMLPNEINQEIDKFAIILRGEMNSKGTPKMIGMVGTNRWSTNTPGKEMETGYCLNMAYWGKGYATEAFTCFLKYFWTISERKNMNTLIAKTSPENKDSQRVLQKCGARKGETLTDAYERWVDKGAKSDLLCWYFDRPSLIVEYENKDEGKRGANIRVSGK